VALADKKFCLFIGNWDRNGKISWTGFNSNTELRSTLGEMRYSVSWLLGISGHGGRLLSPGCSHQRIVLQVMSSLETSLIALCEYYEPDTILMSCINTRESYSPLSATERNGWMENWKEFGLIHILVWRHQEHQIYKVGLPFSLCCFFIFHLLGKWQNFRKLHGCNKCTWFVLFIIQSLLQTKLNLVKSQPNMVTMIDDH
jgi:hypothetical protein